MATTYTPGLTWGAPLGPPDKKPEHYLCELKWNGWFCAPETTNYKKAPDVLCTKLISVPEYIPSFLERPYVWLQMKELPVRVKNQPK